MNIKDNYDLLAGGPGSGCNPAAGHCGRHGLGIPMKQAGIHGQVMRELRLHQGHYRNEYHKAVEAAQQGSLDIHQKRGLLNAVRNYLASAAEFIGAMSELPRIAALKLVEKADHRLVMLNQELESEAPHWMEKAEYLHAGLEQLSEVLSQANISPDAIHQSAVALMPYVHQLGQFITPFISSSSTSVRRVPDSKLLRHKMGLYNRR